VIVVPGKSEVIALAPKFITPQDGAEKQDCEINAAKRWLANSAKCFEGLLSPTMICTNRPFRSSLPLENRK